MCFWNIHLRIQDILETSVRFDGDTNNPSLQTVLAIQKIQCREERFILSTIRCKWTESLPQAGNDETTNSREHACKAKWDGLYSSDTVSKYYRQHGRGKRTHHEKSTGKEATKALPVWLHQKTYKFPPSIALWNLQLERPENWPWGWGYLNMKQRRQQKKQQQWKRENVWRQRPLGRVKNKQLR